MMGIFRSLDGMVTVELTGADLSASLGMIAASGIPVFEARSISELTIRFKTRRRDTRKLSAICKKRGDSFRVLGRSGIYWVGKSLLKRPILVAAAIFFTLLVMGLPTRVYFIQVEGNSMIPANQILEAAEKSGIVFGASRKAVRSEQVKNALLEEVPELQWAGVNTAGCVAVISVRERSVPEESSEKPAVGSIVASRDGVIQSCTATKGNLVCTPGQAVKAGEVLISGYTDCGLTIQATCAEGEVFAETMHDVSVVTPSQYVKKGEKTAVKYKYSLLMGKKRINLWKDSGIWDATCGRMYREYYVTLPGGFRLPVALVVEEYTVSAVETDELTQEDAERNLALFSTQYLTQRMIAGSIVSKNVVTIPEPGRYRLKGEYVCIEMIGKIQREKIGENNGQNN